MLSSKFDLLTTNNRFLFSKISALSDSTSPSSSGNFARSTFNKTSSPQINNNLLNAFRNIQNNLSQPVLQPQQPILSNNLQNLAQSLNLGGSMNLLNSSLLQNSAQTGQLQNGSQNGSLVQSLVQNLNQNNHTSLQNGLNGNINNLQTGIQSGHLQNSNLLQSIPNLQNQAQPQVPQTTLPSMLNNFLSPKSITPSKIAQKRTIINPRPPVVTLSEESARLKEQQNDFFNTLVKTTQMTTTAADDTSVKEAEQKKLELEMQQDNIQVKVEQKPLKNSDGNLQDQENRESENVEVPEKSNCEENILPESPGVDSLNGTVMSSPGAGTSEVGGKIRADGFTSVRRRTLHSDVPKPHVCTICNSKFTRYHNLKQHIKLHSGIKPYQCEHCGKRFTRNYTLRLHKMKVCNSERVSKLKII